ncbi:MAG: ABC transporter permease [Verrucomicrobiae bacterium]|nr:ABC transporter permease [Verrucomicrobiae bacterium]
MKFALRQLLKNPGFTAVAVLTLALSLGANLAIFAVVDAILLRPLPFPEPDRLAVVFNSYPQWGVGRVGSSFPNLYGRRGRIEAFSSVAGFKNDTGIVGEPGGGLRAEILRVSPDFFDTLRVHPQLGRGFTEDEMTFETHHVAILSDAYWRRHFDADPGVLGREVRVNGFTKTIVGVLPPGFRLLSSSPQLLLPLSSTPEQRGIHGLHEGDHCEMIARLRPGASFSEAQAQVDAHNAVAQRDFPFAKEVEASGFRTQVRPWRAEHVEGIRPTLLLLQAGGLFLLLIGAVNLVNLLLVRASAHSKELALRLALGASRLQIIRQVMTETALLALVGGLAGLGVGAAGVRLLEVLGVDRLPLGLSVTLDGRVALAALLGTVLVGILAGIPLAWFNLRSRPVDALQSASRSSTAGPAAQRLRHGFVTAQMALAFVLLSGSGLLALSLKRTMEISPGFRPDQVLAGHISMIHRSYFDAPVRLRFAERVLEAVQQLPGVEAAGIVTSLPVTGKVDGFEKRIMTAANSSVAAGDPSIAPCLYGTAGDYFRALGIPLRAGRLFDGSESRRDERVCLVDETFARRHWPDGNALGQRVYDGTEVAEGKPSFRVVGVVGAVKQTALTEQSKHGAVYLPLRDHTLPANNLHVVVRTAQKPDALAVMLRKAVRDIEPELPIHDLRPMETRIADSLVARRSPALLAGIFAGVALLLAAIGTYGVLSFAVAQQRREIGVRMALGALPKQIAGQFLRMGMRLLLWGAGMGVLGAWLAGRAMQGILFNIPPLHPATLAGTAVLLGAVALLACWLPARRAARVDPMEALRAE